MNTSKREMIPEHEVEKPECTQRHQPYRMAASTVIKMMHEFLKNAEKVTFA